MIYSFVWNGWNCRDKGIRMREMPPVIRPEERVQHVTIPGRAGELTLTEGTDIYNSYIQTIPVAVYTEANVREAESWLRGEGTVSFCSQPHLQQAARVINAVEFRKHSRNSVYWDADIQFYCNPIKYLVSEADITLAESGQSITCPGTLDSYPLITIHGGESFAFSIRIWDRTLTIPNAADGMVIDTENQWILVGGVPIMNACSGRFPKLMPGENILTFTGASSITITPRSRFL